MRSFENRDDTTVLDEPLYGHYLYETGKDHPMGEEIKASMDCDSQSVGTMLCAPLPSGTDISYQKHMAHHLLPSTSREWMKGMRHGFLIRDPRAMLASLAAKLGKVELADTGLPQQVEIFTALRMNGGNTPPVIDSGDLLADPEAMLRVLCERLEIPFRDSMLAWESGPRASDGIWGSYWYGNTNRSTGFSPPKTNLKPVALPSDIEPLARECEALYSSLAEHRIQTN